MLLYSIILSLVLNLIHKGLVNSWKLTLNIGLLLLYLIDLLILDYVSLLNVRDISSKDLVSNCIIFFLTRYLIHSSEFIIDLSNSLIQIIDLGLLLSITSDLICQVLTDLVKLSGNLTILLTNSLDLCLLLSNWCLQASMSISISSSITPTTSKLWFSHHIELIIDLRHNLLHLVYFPLLRSITLVLAIDGSI